jgi:hypothetical protein
MYAIRNRDLAPAHRTAGDVKEGEVTPFLTRDGKVLLVLVDGMFEGYEHVPDDDPEVAAEVARIGSVL